MDSTSGEINKSKAIERLQKLIKEIPRLRGLNYENSEFGSWRARVNSILSLAFDDEDYMKFINAKLRSDMRLMGDEVHQSNYEHNLTTLKTILQSIVDKHELLETKTQPTSKREPKGVVRVFPESIFRKVPPKVFISHGRESAALRELKEFIETLGIEPLIEKEQASLDKDLPDKVNLYLNQADFVIVLATGDDTVRDKITGAEIIQPRQNVIHEIGLAQKTHPGRVIYLLEEGANFPSNIRPRVWDSFRQRHMMGAFLGIVRELRAYGMLEITKYPVE
jgi:predicted nucleotide-binding protein